MGLYDQIFPVVFKLVLKKVSMWSFSKYLVFDRWVLFPHCGFFTLKLGGSVEYGCLLFGLNDF